DILFPFGLGAMVAFFFRRLSPRWLISIGCLVLLVPPIFNEAFALALPHLGQETLVEIEKSWRPTPEQTQEELAVYRGGWLEQMADRVPNALMMETIIFAVWSSWRAGGLMLIGMALFKLGVV